MCYIMCKYKKIIVKKYIINIEYIDIKVIMIGVKERKIIKILTLHLNRSFRR